ncbi:MAG TPA: arsenite methyltransferase [Planctomycetota bacterium]|nr:arsenite methyltransferase [Planctomycetota bacterium]HRR82433.1 arsenite methyltransferase [Planctomycetota bacterium]HRT95703.1 arsenite methyltransferase [Planctomycetota bacterium]
MSEREDTHELVKKAYGSVARKQSSCCGPKASCCGKAPAAAEGAPVPEADMGLSCGDPVAFSHLKPGDVVLDLGSGGGKDVFLAAQRVGPTGRAIGVDMTPDMLALARRNAAKFRQATGLDNVEFREGEIEHLPVENGSVDVVISNCVVNLSPDKPQVFREVHRVLKPGGRMVVSDIVLNRPFPESLRDDEDLYAACLAGALPREDYLGAIRAAGFASLEVLTDRLYEASSVCDDPITDEVAETLEGVASSITVLAVR